MHKEVEVEMVMRVVGPLCALRGNRLKESKTTQTMWSI